MAHRGRIYRETPTCGVLERFLLYLLCFITTSTHHNRATPPMCHSQHTAPQQAVQCHPTKPPNQPSQKRPKGEQPLPEFADKTNHIHIQIHILSQVTTPAPRGALVFFMDAVRCSSQTARTSGHIMCTQAACWTAYAAYWCLSVARNSGTKYRHDQSSVLWSLHRIAFRTANHGSRSSWSNWIKMQDPTRRRAYRVGCSNNTISKLDKV